MLLFPIYKKEGAWKDQILFCSQAWGGEEDWGKPLRDRVDDGGHGEGR